MKQGQFAVTTVDPSPNTTVPTLADVAQHAGVSTATVSRCLNSPDQVSKRTRDRVMTAVRSLGYAPNFSARALAAKRTNTFGAIIPTMENAIFARGLQAFQAELDRHGITLLVASSSYRPDLEEEQIRALIARGADALLLIGHDRTPAAYRVLEQRQIPCLVAWAYDETQMRPAIGFDNRAAMAELAGQVLALGHTQLGFITAHRAHNDRARARYDGLCDAMIAAGLDPQSLRIEETTYSVTSGREALTRLLQDGPRPTAVLCGNDVLAVGAIKQAQIMGLTVPDDLSITGFDDIEIADIIAPGLTTVHVPHREMGRRAAQKLLAMRNGDTTPQSTALKTRVVWRNSVCPPRPNQG